jgi:hypothetical protein
MRRAEAVRRHRPAPADAVPEGDRAAGQCPRIYLARTLRLCRGKQEGLVIVNITRPTACTARSTHEGDFRREAERCRGRHRRFDQRLAVRLCRRRPNGLKVLQLTSARKASRIFYGFSPAPKPELIAWARHHRPRWRCPRASTATAGR